MYTLFNNLDIKLDLTAIEIMKDLPTGHDGRTLL